MKPLSIAMVSFPSIGGSGAIAVGLSHELRSHGHDVVHVSSARPARLETDAPFAVVPPTEHALFERSPYTLALASTLVRLAKERALDVVHLHYAVPHAASAFLAAHALGASRPAFVLTMHGTDVLTLSSDDAHGPVTAASLAALDGWTTPSKFLSERCATSLGVEPQVIPNFVDGAVFRPEAAAPERLEDVFGGATQRAKTLIHVSTFRAVKATHELVPMMVALRAMPAATPVRLLLVGDGPERERVRRDAAEAGVLDAMRFVDPIQDPAELARWVAAADLFVLPSEVESFGLAALEALSCGVPVVARRVGGVPEVVRHEATGILVDRPGELASAVRSLIDDDAKRAAMSLAARADARSRFAPDVVTREFEAMYERARNASTRVRGSRTSDGDGDA